MGMGSPAASGAARDRRRRAAALALAAAVLTGAPPARAEPERGIFSLVVENDLFYGADRDYTNGVHAAWLSGPDRAPALALRFARWFPLFPEHGTVRAVYGVGQTMYTPDDITVPDPPPGERPYAGWLYGTIGLIAETGRELDQLALTLGVVGPAALAEQAQKLAHGITGSTDPQGWDTQLENEPGAVLTYQRSWRSFAADTLLGLGFDATPHAGGAVGNVFTYANAGLTLRVGDPLPLDFGPPRIQPSLPGSGFFVPADGFDWYLFAGAEARLVGRNIFLDGNSFRDSRSVDKKPLVGDFQFGIVLTWEDLRLSYTHVLRTREYDGQDEGDEFGTISLSVRY